MAQYSLSKSTYIKGLQCLKYLYLYKKHYKLKDKLSPQKLSTFRRGTNVGILARDMFKGGVDLSPVNHFKTDDALNKTKLHLEMSSPILYEASFKYDDIIIFLDILVREENGWHAYEVKSSAEISETYLHDASLQYYVITASGLKLYDFSLITVNNTYKRGEQIDVHKFFRITSVFGHVVSKKEFVCENIKTQKNILAQDNIPEIDIGSHCYKPYDCEYIGFCWKKIEHHPVLNADSEILTTEEKINLYKQDGQSLLDSLSQMNIEQQRLLKIECQIQKTEHINTEKLNLFFKSISSKICFLDLQCLKPAVPLFENNKPYEKYPFLLTISGYGLDEDKQDVFLCGSHNDERLKLIKFLIDKTTKYDTVIVYDINFINEYLHELIEEKNSYKTTYDLFLKKTTALKEVITQNFYYSHKIKSMDFYILLVSLNLKNPYPQINKINNSFEAHDAFLEYAGNSDKKLCLEIKEKLFEFGRANVRYLSRLFTFIQKKL